MHATPAQQPQHLVKLKTIDLKDSNIAMLGTDLEKKVRLAASQGEPAWTGVGAAVGLRVFRIEKFTVVAWPEKDYGMFYSGDSYIVINTWKKKDEPTLYHDIHFWLGLKTSQDEAGTAAYKTVELDDYLGTLPVQHREVQGSESSLFLSYFKHFHVQEGGIESGFHHVGEETYTPRLFQVRLTRPPADASAQHRRLSPDSLVVREVALAYRSLNSGDVFIADAGRAVLQWNGAASAPLERQRAAEHARRIADERNGRAKISVFEEGDADATPFWEAIGGRGPVMSAAEAEKLNAPVPFEKALFRLSDRTGKLTFKEESRGAAVARSKLDPADVYVVDAGDHVYVWIGRASDKEERRCSMQYAVEYLSRNGRPLASPITRVLDGAEATTYGFVAAMA